MDKEPLYITDADALVTAAYEGDLQLVQRLVTNVKDINVTNEQGETAVIVASENGYDVIVELLLKNGANINVKDNDGDTALDIAKYHENKSTVVLLLSHGALGTDGPSAKERMMDSYYDAMNSIQSKYFDDRMFVLEVTMVTTRSLTDPAENRKTSWAVITRRNVPGYPPYRSDEFDSKEDAVAYLKKIAPETPRVSLDGNPLIPTPTWENHQEWLEEIGECRLPY